MNFAGLFCAPFIVPLPARPSPRPLGPPGERVCPPFVTTGEEGADFGDRFVKTK
ncbi:hypothetical protein HMPREF0262_03189 [Clostridium sp. ATCC 29733]|nr:hypothetical protein HMPREF0262_03189 [Clostridium sp. ATCC 29733]